jgi:hypothetical protein
VAQRSVPLDVGEGRRGVDAADGSRARHPRVGDDEVDVTCLEGDARRYALQVGLGARVALQGDGVAVLLRVPLGG